MAGKISEIFILCLLLFLYGNISALNDLEIKKYVSELEVDLN